MGGLSLFLESTRKKGEIQEKEKRVAGENKSSEKVRCFQPGDHTQKNRGHVKAGRRKGYDKYLDY